MGREQHEPHAVLEFVDQVRAGLQGKARLAGAASSNQRDHRSRAYEFLQILQLRIAPDEARGLKR